MHVRICALLFVLGYSNTVWGTVSIKGKIIGYDGKSIVYYHPTIEGIYTPYWKEIKPSSNGTFKIEFENQGYGNTKISYKNSYYRFFHDTDSKIYFEIKELKGGTKRRIPGNKIFVFADSLKQLSTIRIAGDYDAINKFYNRNMRSSYATTHLVDGTYYSDLIYKTKSLITALAVLDSLKKIEIDQIDKIPIAIDRENKSDEDREKEIKKFLINEVHAFYGAVFLNGMFLKRKDQVIKKLTDSTSNPNVYNPDWEVLVERLIEQAKADLDVIPNSPDYVDFMQAMAYAQESYKQYDFPQNPSMSLDEMVMQRLFNYDTTLFHDRKARFAYELAGLQLYLNDQLFYSPALLHAVYDLQSKHPGSIHFEFYNDRIDKLKYSLEKSKEDFRGAKIIHAKFDSFGELLNRFAGKNVLIDIWATWCHPCIEEFSHKTMIQTFMESDKLDVLYISIDKPEWADRWKQSIRINELQGSHFRADRAFITDMWNVIGDFKGAIPRYVLVDKAGKIFRSTAARPSEGNKLMNQIEELIR
jgi:thiol-disulfide isomerase/thioredoxin